MLNTKNEAKEYRYNLKLPTAAQRQLENLVAKSNSGSIAEVLRRSIAIYDFLTEHNAPWELVLRNKETGIEKILKFL